MRVVIPLHEAQSVVEDCRFVWNKTGSQLGYGVGFVQFKRTNFIGSDPDQGGTDALTLRLWGHLPPVAAEPGPAEETIALPEADAPANRQSDLGV